MSTKLSRKIHFYLRYLGKPPWDTGVSPPELLEFLHSAVPGKALDVGCGTGTNLLIMASLGWNVVGIDQVWLSVLRARAKLNKGGVAGRVIHGDASGQPKLGDDYILVVDIGCYHSLNTSERAAYRQNLARWLKPGGTFMLYAHLKPSPEDAHGVSEEDLAHFSNFMYQQWRQDSDERRPDGGGGRPACWTQFKREV